jgi:hypothetical protein
VRTSVHKYGGLQTPVLVALTRFMDARGRLRSCRPLTPRSTPVPLACRVVDAQRASLRPILIAINWPGEIQSAAPTPI